VVYVKDLARVKTFLHVNTQLGLVMAFVIPTTTTVCVDGTTVTVVEQIITTYIVQHAYV
jgi:hypothetical protein